MKTIKNRFDSLAIKWKVFIYLTGFCACLLILLWLMQVVFLSTIYKNVRIGQMNNAARKIEVAMKNGSDTQLITDIATDNDACVMIIAPNGTLMHSADVRRECSIHKASYMDILKLVTQTKKNGGQLKGIYSKNGPFRPDMIVIAPDYSARIKGPQSMIYCKQVTQDDNSIGYILINISLTPVDSTVTTIKIQLCIITGAMLLFSLLLASVISKKVAQPIEQLSEQAGQLATGDYETVFNAKGYAEISRLSDTLTQTAQELGKVESLRKEFIANVSHDLRTPLTLIGGYAELMRDIPGENNSENAQSIINETQRLSSLVNDVLDMSRIQSGAVPMEKKQYNLTAAVQKTVNNMQDLLKQDGYVMYFESDGTVMVNADEARISQCFYNILINAVNHTGQDKHIYIKLSSGDGMAKISVTDTGAGVAEKDLPYVWERYYKNDKNHRRSVTGTGIGLSIVRSVIKAHNGQYGVYNTSGKGACFWFSIPIE